MDDVLKSRSIRLKTLIKQLKIKQVAFAKKLDTNPGFISQMVNGRRKVTEAFAYQISSSYKFFNPAWLINGSGDMFLYPPGEDGNVLNDPESVYQKSLQGDPDDPLDMLRDRLANYEARISKLENHLYKMEDSLEEIMKWYEDMIKGE